MMMDYSISTVYMTIFTSNLLLILISLFFRKDKVMVNLGYRLLAIFVCITFLRFLFPFEFSFTTTFALPKPISLVVVLLRHPFFFVFGYGVTLWSFLEIVWLVGGVVFAVRYIKEIRLLKQYILLKGKKPANSVQYKAILDEICTAHKKKNHFRILEIEQLDSPKLYGIRRPYILLPANLSFSDEDMFFILSHEATHHFHHDIILKVIVRILSIVYWWNPACHKLNSQAAILLEMRVDDSITNESDKKKTAQYLSCLLTLAEQCRKENYSTNTFILSFSQLDKKALTKRFEMLIERNTPRNQVLNMSITVAMLFVYIISYFYTFEASYFPPEVASTISITKDSSYFIQNEDGTYDLYYADIYFETVTSLEYFYDDVPIYTQEEFDKLFTN